VRLLPRDEQFYDLFNELAKRLTASARLLTRLFEEPQHLERFVAEIKTVEHEADSLTHEVSMRINKSFITPFDREDIHMLASRLDDVIDLIDGTARRAQMFHIRDVREPARRLCDVLSRAAVCIESAVAGMKKAKIVSERAREIKRLEEEGDAIYHEAVGGLFSGTPDALDVIKWKELYDTLERALDQCEDVANTLESISLKNA
jgi:predicted phosphate transport protein (TIGR00153 family)